METLIAPQAERPGKRRALLRPRNLALVLFLTMLIAACTPPRPTGGWAGISVDASGLIMANFDRVVRLNESGTARWEFPPSGERGQTQFYSTPAIVEDIVYVGGYDRIVYALDRDNSQELWRNEDAQAQIIAGLVVAGGRVLVGQGDHGLMALNQLTGELEWRFETEQGVWATPVVVDDVVYFTALDHHIYALRLDDGEELWSTDLEGAVAGTPAYDPEFHVLFVGSFARKLYAVDARDGAILATFDANQWVWGGPVLDDGVLYYGDLAGFVYAVTFDAEDREFNPIWQRQVADAGIRARPLVLEDMLIVGSQDQRVYALDRERGTSIWFQDTGAQVLSDPVLLEDSVVVVGTLSAERMLVAYDAADAGIELWQYPPAAAGD